MLIYQFVLDNQRNSQQQLLNLKYDIKGTKSLIKLVYNKYHLFMIPLISGGDKEFTWGQTELRTWQD